jgi:hypothetical protein
MKFTKDAMRSRSITSSFFCSDFLLEVLASARICFCYTALVAAKSSEEMCYHVSDVEVVRAFMTFYYWLYHYPQISSNARGLRVSD